MAPLRAMAAVTCACSSAAGRTLVDDAEGRATSLAQIEQNAKAAHRAQQAAIAQQQAEQGGHADATQQGQGQQELGQQRGVAQQAATALGLASSGGGGRAHRRSPLPPRMTGVYLGCLENKGGFFPIRDQASKW